MQLPYLPSDSSIREYKRLWAAQFGQELTDAEAADHITHVVGFFAALIEAEANSKQRESP